MGSPGGPAAPAAPPAALRRWPRGSRRGGEAPRWRRRGPFESRSPSSCRRQLAASRRDRRSRARTSGTTGTGRPCASRSRGRTPGASTLTFHRPLRALRPASAWWDMWTSAGESSREGRRVDRGPPQDHLLVPCRTCHCAEAGLGQAASRREISQSPQVLVTVRLVWSAGTVTAPLPRSRDRPSTVRAPVTGSPSAGLDRPVEPAPGHRGRADVPDHRDLRRRERHFWPVVDAGARRGRGCDRC